ncbi:hypothetical protein VTJ04DRAFT_336 [Mycothermus thermophilus]|uniref:uncharacterized protein n=1 Tax=Humicola insolens TaxID=85995 RepID=UPI003742DE34
MGLRGHDHEESRAELANILDGNLGGHWSGTNRGPPQRDRLGHRYKPLSLKACHHFPKCRTTGSSSMLSEISIPGYLVSIVDVEQVGACGRPVRLNPHWSCFNLDPSATCRRKA